MKKIFLGSSSKHFSKKKLKNIIEFQTKKNIFEVKIIVIFCPETKNAEIKYFRKTKKTLIDLGFSKKNITIVNINKKVNLKKFNINNFDVFWTTGGNTFLILDRIRKNGFDSFIKRFVKLGKLYIGFSAGSIILFKSIEIAGIGKGADINKIGLKDLRGLFLVNFAVLPHYTKKQEKDLFYMRKNLKYKIKEIYNREAITVFGDDIKKIS